MKSSTSVFSLWLALLAFLFAASPARSQEMVIFAKIEGPPKHFVNSAGESSGYAVEIAVEAVRRAGYQPQVQHMPWNRAQESARAGEGLITAFSVTESRAEHFLFTEPMYVDRVLLWQSRNNIFPFETFADLQGRLIGIPRGSHYSGEFEQARAGLRLYEDSHHANRIKMLRAGRLDAAIFSGDIASMRFHADQLGLDLAEFVHSETPIALDPNHIGVPLALRGFDPREVLDRLNEALAAMAEEGATREILDKYL